MQSDIQNFYDAGAHVGYARSRRHPSAARFIFTTRDRLDFFDLEETKRSLEEAKEFATSITGSGKYVLFVGGKEEVQGLVKSAAESAGQPFVTGRWIGGTLTNFKNIRKRLERLEKLEGERERGELGKYTKRERLLIDREIEELQGRFGGIVSMTDLPGALFVVDTRHEKTAVTEANQLGIPVIGLASSDCDFSQIARPIPANDTSVRSVKLVCAEISEACLDGKKAPAAPAKRQSEAQ